MNTSGPARLSPRPLPCGSEATWSVALDVLRLQRQIELCLDTPATTKEKGARLEELLTWLLAHLPGVTVRLRNHYSADRAQEIDLTIWNEQHPGGCAFMGPRVIAECKNWQGPVDSSDVAWFQWKMRLGGVDDGILLAANGITTDATRRSFAASIVTESNAGEPPRRIYVLTLNELAALSSTEDLRDLLIEKSCRLAARNPF